MQSLTRSNNKKAAETEMLQSINKQHIYEDCLVESICFDKNCQDDQSIYMQPVKPPMDMWLPKPVVPYQYKRLCIGKKCQSTRHYKKRNPVKQGYVCYDKNCQDDQCVIMWPVKSGKSSNKWLPKPPME